MSDVKMILLGSLIVIALLSSTQVVKAIMRPMSPLELKKAVIEQPYWRNMVGNSSLVADDKIRLCGEQADLLKQDYGSNTFSRKTGEFLVKICDHNVLYWKGMCITYFNIFSYCGPSGNLQAYLEIRNLTNNLPEKQFLNFGDGSIDENSTNIYLKQNTK
jgi:hypothetical protein